jgi:outer membrane protein assembly factor BamB
VKRDRKPATLFICLLVLSLAATQASDHRTKLSQPRTVSLPLSSVLEEHAQPLITASGKVGFVASVTGGSLISFSVTSGKILSSVAVGETLGSISMIETSGRRLVAVPAVNDPSSGNPATVTVIEATNAKRLELKSLLVLPSDARIVPATEALLTRDGRFCLIASSFDVPTLFLFDVETGQLVSHVALIGRPSEIALYDADGKRKIAIASAEGSNLSVIKIDDQGGLTAGATFSPSIARFDQANNPAFSSDGRMLYIAASTGERLYAIDSESGIIIDSIEVNSPERISVATTADGAEIVACTRIRRPSNAKGGGVTVIANQDGRLTTRSEFTPPDGIDFSQSNNVAFTGDASTAFVGSATGLLFAFNTQSGDLESYQQVGSELRRIALSEKARSVAAVRSASGGDEVTIISFDMVGPDGADPSAPAIESLSPDVVEQGRLRNLRLVVTGANFTEGSSLLVNGIEMGADLVNKGKGLQTKLPKSFFDQIAQVTVQVKAANGALSQPRELSVVRPGAPVIDRITPTEVPGPSGPFTLTVKGSNFRISSAIVVAGQTLNTEQISSKALQAVVPAEIANVVGRNLIKVQVKDLSVPDLVSPNDQELLIFGPRISDLRPAVETIVAGDRKFVLRILGDNFREGAEVSINNSVVPASQISNLTKKVIKVVVPGDLFQDAGTLKVVVRNSTGVESDPKELDVHAPEIESVAPGKLFAGMSDAQVDIFGKNFRRRARVYVRNASQAFQVPAAQVRFRNNTHIVVTLGGESGSLLVRPDTLRFEVVNRNAADGVQSADHSLEIVGPSVTDALIEPVTDNDSQVRVTIAGANFRRGAVVEFVKDGATVLQQTPVKRSGGIVRVIVRAKKLDALGNFQVRVVNPGSSPVPSNPFSPRNTSATNGID